MPEVIVPATSVAVVLLSKPVAVLSAVVFWATVFFALHFYDETLPETRSMDRMGRFCMEVIASAALATMCMVLLTLLDLVVKSWL